jgi:NitT/TauT family transport system substrate-binding protein
MTMHPLDRRRRPAGRRSPGLRLVAVTAAAGLLAVACGSSHSRSSAGSVPSQLTGSARCAANRAAGTITYLTGFQYQGDTGIIDVIAAADEGLFSQQCLHVVIRPGTGDPGTTAQLTAAGKVTISELGAPSDAITVHDNGIDVQAVATYGNVPAITLLTMPTITNLKQLEGKTLGYKGAMPPQITAMLQAAGVEVAKVHEVSVGYDPTILPRGQVAALTAYKSNEPIQLAADGFTVREWDPDSFGIKGSFNVLIANPAFAAAHPSALDDFLRATFHAYQGCVSDPQPCIADAAKRQSGYDIAQNLKEWQTQTAEVSASALAGQGLGAQSVAQWQPEADLLVADHLVKHTPDLPALIDTAPVDAIESGTQVIWPAP